MIVKFIGGATVALILGTILNAFGPHQPATNATDDPSRYQRALACATNDSAYSDCKALLSDGRL